jgi:predicted ATP-binding protein involved in virulence
VPEAKTPDGWVPVRELSTGYKATMAWATDFMARMLERYPNSANPCAEPAVVLIDQIDTHLHPKWQRQLIADLSRIFPATQFIVTAHSPLMVQAMPEANIAVLRRNGEGVRICNQLDDIRGWRLDQIVASELFEEQPTRDVETNDKLARRRELLVKKQLPVSERAELKKLNEWADKLPTADTLEDIRAMDIIRRASEKIKPSET